MSWFDTFVRMSKFEKLMTLLMVILLTVTVGGWLAAKNLQFHQSNARAINDAIGDAVSHAK